jgi:hypothetical protein
MKERERDRRNLLKGPFLRGKDMGNVKEILLEFIPRDKDMLAGSIQKKGRNSC